MLAFRCAPTGMAIISLDGRWVEVNEALCRSLGYAATELVGDSVETFVHPGDLAGVSLPEQLVAGEISSGQVDQRFVRRDGTVVWLRVSCALVRDDDGEPDCFIAQCEDVTEAKAIEQELARERRWLVESQAAGRVGSWELDLETGEGRWSREQFNLYGVDPDGPVPGLDALLELIHDDDRGAMLESLRRHMATGEDFIDEYRIRQPRLGVRALLVRGRYLPRDPDLGRPARMAGTTLDVTAERSVEAARQRGEDRLRLLATIVQQSDDAIIVCGTNGLIAQWNDGASRLYGYTAAEAIGRRLSFLAPPERGQEGEELIRGARSGEAVRGLHTIRRRRDGSLVQVSLTVSPIIGGDGEPMGVSVIARDITAQVIAQDRLLNNERQMDEAQALAHVGSWEWNLSLERPTWSAEMARLYCFEPEHVPEVSDLVARIHLEDRDRVWRSIRDARTGRSSEEEYRVVGADGEIRHMLGRHRTRPRSGRGHAHLRRRPGRDRAQALRGRPRAARDPRRADRSAEPPHFEDRLTMELARARRDGATVSLALIDIDPFKRINDRSVTASATRPWQQSPSSSGRSARRRADRAGRRRGVRLDPAGGRPDRSAYRGRACSPRDRGDPIRGGRPGHAVGWDLHARARDGLRVALPLRRHGPVGREGRGPQPGARRQRPGEPLLQPPS